MNTGAIPATMLYAGIMGLLAVALATQVLWARINAKKLPDWKPDTTMRVQANFVENVPLALILLYLLEAGGAPTVMVHVLGAALVIARLLHAWGYSGNPGATYPRLIGAQTTFLLLSIMGFGLIYLALAPRL
ncbi:MAPEG family protein [Iodidimonas sp. SYSU 1G8]|uniref:MAPEG family protein n=1 Tax=Iodidimonas sp. SYSU 1G8 TaxID=3133967 RepID=UPI0031FE5C92